MRQLGTVTAANCQARAAKWATLVELDFPDATERFCTGRQDIEFGGHTYVGLGSIVGFSQSEEKQRAEALRMDITFGGVPAQMLSRIFTTQIIGNEGRIYVLAYDGNGPAERTLEHSGLMDRPGYQIENGVARIVIPLESELASGGRAEGRRFTDATQRARYPDDGSCRHTPEMARKVLVFPGAEFFRRG